MSEVSGVADGRCVGPVGSWIEANLAEGNSHLEAFMLFQMSQGLLHYASNTSKLFKLERGSTLTFFKLLVMTQLLSQASQLIFSGQSVIHSLPPTQDASHHQDYYIFSRESL